MTKKMKTALKCATALVCLPAVASAGGIERSTQSSMVLYETGNHLEMSLGFANPSLTGEDVANASINDVADGYYLPSMAIKFDVSDRVALAFTYDRPFGADVVYGSETAVLGGTFAEASTHSFTALAKYQFNENFSVFAGARAVRAEGQIGLNGLAYGAVNGYEVDLSQDTGFGYVVGAAFELPDIALRAALTYNSQIDLTMGATESGPLITVAPGVSLPLLNGSSDLDVTLPESITFDFQTGIAPDTLLFGSIRHVKHSQFRVDPEQFVTVAGGGLIDLEDSTTYRLGVGRRFSDAFAASISVAYEKESDNDLVSPLAPSNGYKQIALGGSYSIDDSTTLSAGISYTKVGDARPETGTPDTERADFDDNGVVGFGIKLAYKF